MAYFYELSGLIYLLLELSKMADLSSVDRTVKLILGL